jgi:peptide/nickel transport system substrate-binding protein
MEDEVERAEAITRGAADIVFQFPRSRWRWGRAQPSLQLLSTNGLHAVLAVFSLAEGSPFEDLNLRRAVALAVDRDALVREGLHDLGVPLDQPVPPDVLGYSPGLPRPAPDAEQARRLVDEAGWPRGREVPLYSALTYDTLVRTLEGQLESTGIGIEARVLPQSEFYRKLTTESLPLAVFGWSAHTGDASATLDPLFHSPTDGLGSFNRFAYSNPRFDSLIDGAHQASRPRDRLRLFGQALEVLRQDVPVVPLVTLSDLYAVRQGLAWDPPVDRILRVEDVRVVDAGS